MPLTWRSSRKQCDGALGQEPCVIWDLTLEIRGPVTLCRPRRWAFSCVRVVATEPSEPTMTHSPKPACARDRHRKRRVRRRTSSTASIQKIAAGEELFPREWLAARKQREAPSSLKRRQEPPFGPCLDRLKAREAAQISASEGGQCRRDQGAGPVDIFTYR